MVYFTGYGDGLKFRPRPCRRCGLRHRFGQCRAIGAKCNFCSRYNHFARKCFFRKQQQFSVVQHPVSPVYQQSVFHPLPVSSVEVPVSAAPTAQRQKKKKSAKRKARDQRRMDRFKLLQEEISVFPFVQLSDHDLHSELNTGFTQQTELSKCKSKISSYLQKLKQANKVKLEQLASVSSLETQISNKDSFIAGLESCISNLESELKEVKYWKDKIAKSNEIQSEIMDELNEKIMCHIESIRHLEYKLAPGV